MSTAIVITLLAISCLLAFIPKVTATTITAPTTGTTGTVGQSVSVTGTIDTEGGSFTVYWDSIKAWDGIGGSLVTDSTAAGSMAYSVNIVIPQATAGAHNIIVRDLSSASATGVQFLVQPRITVTPSTVFPGDTVTVSGTGFDSASAITLMLGAYLLPSSSVTTNSLGSFATSAVIPASTASGTYTLSAYDAAINVAATTINIGDPYYITLIPTSGPVGTALTMTGKIPASTAYELRFAGATITTGTSASNGAFTNLYIIPAVSPNTYLFDVVWATNNTRTAPFTVTPLTTINRTVSTFTVIPDPVVVNDFTSFDFEISPSPPAGKSYTNIMYEVVKPDGTHQTLGPYTTAPGTGTLPGGVAYAPDQVGTYSVRVYSTSNQEIDGAVYTAFSSSFVDFIVIFEPIADQPPVAAFSYSPNSPMVVGEIVVFDASGSYDLDGNITSYFWDFRDFLTGSSVGMFNYSSPVCSFSFPNPIVYRVTLTVTDNSFLTDSISHQVTVVQEFDLIIQNEGYGGTTNPDPGTYTYVEGTGVAVQFIHVSDSEWVFDHWLLDGVNVSSNDLYTVSMDDNHVLTAVSLQQLASLDITIEGSGTTNPPADTDFSGMDIGTQVVVTATPSENWRFNHWTLDGTNVGGANPYTVTMDESHQLVAVFLNDTTPLFDLTIQVVGSGSTTPGTGIHMLEEGMVTATAYPSDGWKLDCWMLDGQNVSNEETFTCTLGTNSILTAVFAKESAGLLIPPEYVPPIVGGAGAGVAGGGYYVYHKIHHKPGKTGKNGKKTGKEKEKDETKKQPKSPKKANLELTITEYPKTIVGGMTSKAKVRIKNSGPNSTTNVRISVFSSPGLNLQNKTEKVSSLELGEEYVKDFIFIVSQQANRGEYKLRFAVKGAYARRVVQTVTLRAIKIGLLTDPTKEQQLTHYKKWLRNNSLTWDKLHTADNVLKLLSYDVILVAPNFDMPAKWTKNLQSFAENGRMLLRTNKKDAVENEISEKILLLLKNV